MRRNFADIFKEMKIDMVEEYKKLYNLFYGSDELEYSVHEIIRTNFKPNWLSSNTTILDLDEFNRKGNFRFIERYIIETDEIDYLISFCEYIINLSKRFTDGLLVDHIKRLTDQLGYIETEQDGFTIYVEKNLVSIAVAEIVPIELSVKTLSYNHYSMKGDLSTKKSSLSQYADYLEPKREELKSVDKTLESDLFFAFNNFNIRHNNIEPLNNKNYKAFIANMTKDELEKLYDETYQMSLLAILQVDNIERTNYISEVKNKIKVED